MNVLDLDGTRQRDVRGRLGMKGMKIFDLSKRMHRLGTNTGKLEATIG